MTLRVSTTTLESFRRVCETESGDEAELIATVQGKPFRSTWQMQAGIAWENALQRGNVDPAFSFSTDDLANARTLLGPGVWQVKATREYATGYGTCLVVAKADVCHGLTIADVKLKFSPIDLADFEASLQWRYYLHIHEATCFRYHIWVFRSDDPTEGLRPDEGMNHIPCPARVCAVKEYLSVGFFPYNGLGLDCISWLERFLGWAKDRDLLKYLEREGTP